MFIFKGKSINYLASTHSNKFEDRNMEHSLSQKAYLIDPYIWVRHGRTLSTTLIVPLVFTVVPQRFFLEWEVFTLREQRTGYLNGNVLIWGTFDSMVVFGQVG